MNSEILPRFHRQRFLLQFIELAGNRLSKIDLQKLLFLAHQERNFRYFDFVPYHFGCYSFQVASDLETLDQDGWVKVMKNEVLLLKTFKGKDPISNTDRNETQRFLSSHMGLRGESLLRYVYERFPYYARNSRMAHRFLKGVNLGSGTTDDDTLLYTIGYEGLTFEAYLNKLIQHKVQVLCDVRQNPLSRKFGFSKSALSRILPKFNISYLHIPELGIVSEKRKSLTTRMDFSRLFNEYSQQLPQKERYIFALDNLIKEGKRVALTCFEHEPSSCHRSYLSNYLCEQHTVPVEHL
ncbi:MAG: DUF488 family protein [Desulfocapsaceae bacterium]|nr:DUF488 family protein [Desulfocapsaceae bacterium]